MRKNRKKRASLIAAEQATEALLRRVGYTGKYTGVRVNELPNYKIESNLPPTSDKICAHGPKKASNTYTGSLIAGIATMHKSNAVPILRNTNDAIDVAQMRRN